jgi:hypothetical protein
MKIGMNGAEVDAFVAELKAGADQLRLERQSGVDPAWVEVNRASLLKLAGFEVPAEESADESPVKGRKAKG